MALEKALSAQGDEVSAAVAAAVSAKVKEHDETLSQLREALDTKSKECITMAHQLEDLEAVVAQHSAHVALCPQHHLPAAVPPPFFRSPLGFPERRGLKRSSSDSSSLELVAMSRDCARSARAHFFCGVWIVIHLF